MPCAEAFVTHSARWSHERLLLRELSVEEESLGIQTTGEESAPKKGVSQLHEDSPRQSSTKSRTGASERRFHLSEDGLPRRVVSAVAFRRSAAAELRSSLRQEAACPRDAGESNSPADVCSSTSEEEIRPLDPSRRSWSVQTAETRSPPSFCAIGALEVLGRFAPFPAGAAFRPSLHSSRLKECFRTNSPRLPEGDSSGGARKLRLQSKPPQTLEEGTLKNSASEAPVVDCVRTPEGVLLPPSLAFLLSDSTNFGDLKGAASAEEESSLQSLAGDASASLSSFVGGEEGPSDEALCGCVCFSKRQRCSASADSWASLMAALWALLFDADSLEKRSLCQVPLSDCAERLTFKTERLLHLYHKQCGGDSASQRNSEEECLHCGRRLVNNPGDFCRGLGRLAVAGEAQRPLQLLSLCLLERVAQSLLLCRRCRGGSAAQTAFCAASVLLEKMLSVYCNSPGEVERCLRDNEKQRLLERLLKIALLLCAERVSSAEKSFRRRKCGGEEVALRAALAFLLNQDASFLLRENCADLLAFAAATEELESKRGTAWHRFALWKKEYLHRAPSAGALSALGAVEAVSRNCQLGGDSLAEVALVDLLSSLASLTFLDVATDERATQQRSLSSDLGGVLGSSETAGGSFRMAGLANASASILLKLLPCAELVLFRRQTDACSPLPLSVHLGEALHAVVLRICEAESCRKWTRRLVSIEEFLRKLLCRAILNAESRLSRLVKVLGEELLTENPTFSSEQAELRDVEAALDGVAVLLPVVFLSKDKQTARGRRLPFSACSALCAATTRVLQSSCRACRPVCEDLLPKLLLATTRALLLWTEKTQAEKKETLAAFDAALEARLREVSQALLENAFFASSLGETWTYEARFADDFLKAVSAFCASRRRESGGVDFEEGRAGGEDRPRLEEEVLQTLHSRAQLSDRASGGALTEVECGQLLGAPKVEFRKSILRLRFSSAIIEGLKEPRQQALSARALTGVWRCFASPFLKALVEEASAADSQPPGFEHCSPVEQNPKASPQSRVKKCQLLFDAEAQNCLAFADALTFAERNAEETDERETLTELLDRVRRELRTAFAAVAGWCLESGMSEIPRKERKTAQEGKPQAALLSAEGSRALELLSRLLTLTHALRLGRAVETRCQEKAERKSVWKLLPQVLVALPSLRESAFELWRTSVTVEAVQSQSVHTPLLEGDEAMDTLIDFLDLGSVADDKVSLQTLLSRDDWIDTADALLLLVGEATKTLCTCASPALPLSQRRLNRVVQCRDFLLARIEAEMRERSPPEKQ